LGVNLQHIAKSTAHGQLCLFGTVWWQAQLPVEFPCFGFKK
jgi:hypothetical protein